MSDRNIQVSFHAIDKIDDSLLEYAVICSFHKRQLVCVRHRERQSWEIPGGRRELGEKIDACAVRELMEETGAEVFDIHPLCEYEVEIGSRHSFGRLYVAQIETFGKLPEYEIAEIGFFSELPIVLTYPEIQPKLLEKAMQFENADKV
jgi:8-oxo-dGTP diphosphatase